MGSKEGLIGICTDEHSRHTIDLQNMKAAFEKVWSEEISAGQKPFEVVLFDMCLMSTYETAIALENAVNYMTASQKSTSDRVFCYTGLLTQLSANPKNKLRYQPLVSISAVDLSEIPEIKTASENFGNALSRIWNK